MAKWWEEDMSDASQIMYGDANMALQVATMPNAVLTGNQLASKQDVQNMQNVARLQKAGFMDKVKAFMGLASSAIDKVPGGSLAKSVASLMWTPVDKLASSAYWMYSEAVSQPLSTLILQTGKSQLSDNYGTLFSPDEWADAYGKAEHISPGQAMANVENTMAAAKGEISALSAGVLPFRLQAEASAGYTAATMDPNERADITRQAERFLYDTNYWENRQGWRYTVGTGATDFVVGMALDPVVPVIKGASKVTKGVRHAKIGEGGLEWTAKEAAENNKRVQEFYKWAEGKQAYEIAQHPIWGSGRRKNQFSEAYGQIYATLSKEEMPMITRFALGDPEAFAHVGARNEDLGVQLGRLNDNRIFLDSFKFDEEVLGYFVGEQLAMRQGGGLAGGTIDVGMFPRIVEPPYPRPTDNPIRQAGWDKAYGNLAKEARVYRRAANDILAARNATPRQYFGGVAIGSEDVEIANRWRSAKLDEADIQLKRLGATQKAYADLLGENFGKTLEESSPGASNLFGTSKQLYRSGIAAGSSAKAGDKAVRKAAGSRGNVATTEGGIVSRTLKNGYYRTGYRFYQTFGEKMPQGFVNHNDTDAGQRVMDMLKQVRGMPQEQRIALANEYLSQTDKVSRAKALEGIHSVIIHHYGTAKGLNPEVVSVINDMAKNGIAKTMSELISVRPSNQRFSAAEKEGRMADLVEDGEAHVVMPTAKTQLGQGDVLLPVRDFERFIDRNSGYLQNFKQNTGTAVDFVAGVGDNLSKLWKASTLLRPGYPLRTVSEEAVAAAVKFGLLTSMLGGTKGGWNFARNRAAQFDAWMGKGSYVSSTNPNSKLSQVMIDSPEIRAIAQKHGLKAEKIRVSQAIHVVEGQLSIERKAIDDLDKQIEARKKIGEDITGLLDRKADHQSTLGEFSDYAKEIIRLGTDASGRRLGEGTFQYRGEEVGEVFAKTWENPIPRDQISSERALDALFSRAESINTDRLIKTGNWTTISPDAPNHMESWLHAINLQMRQDDLYRLVAKDGTLKEAKAWLKTAQGRHHLSDLGVWARQPDELLASIKATLDQYLPEGTGLQQKLANNEEIFQADLRAAIGVDDFPTVHGEELAPTIRKFSKESAQRRVDDIISEGYRLLGAIPSDVLVRHPVFNQAYTARMKEAIDAHKDFRILNNLDESITPKEMEKLYEKATQMAKNDIRQVVYDPARTTASEALRFVFPFLSAHSDSLQRWAGLIGEKPQVLAGVSKVYNAPVAAQLVTDGSGNHVGQDGYATIETSYTDANGKKVKTTERKFTPMNERVITFRLPFEHKGAEKYLKEIPGYDVPIKISAINTILPGDPWFHPGTGPVVQAPASVIAKQAPQLGEFMQWSKVLPYGPNDSFTEAFTPKYMRAAYEAFTTDDPDNEKYQKIWLDVYNKHYADNYKTGKPVDMRSVEKEAKDFMKLQVLAAWASPAQTKETPLTGTKYQFFVDQYKKLKEADPANADNIFLENYGEQYFGFTTSVTKSMGVAPSIAAMTKAEEYKDLIEKDPEMAAFIVGDTYNGGGFSASVYRKQMETLMAGKPMREKVSGMQAVRDNQVQLGWSVYMKEKGLLDAQLIQNGFRSYQESGAEGYAETLGQLKMLIGQKYPEWEKVRGVIDTRKTANRIAFFEKAVADKRLQSDPLRFDLAGLDMYLQGRKAFKAELAARGGAKLSFDVGGLPRGENADLGYAWRNFQMSVVAGNTQFHDVFNRYGLDDDDLS